MSCSTHVANKQIKYLDLHMSLDFSTFIFSYH